MLGFSALGEAALAELPVTGATVYVQDVTANFSVSILPSLDVGKIVSASFDGAIVFGAKVLTVTRAALFDATTTVTKSVTFTVTSAAFDVAGSVVKAVGKPISAAISAAIGGVSLAVGKIVSPGANFSVSIPRAVLFAVSSSFDAAITATKAVTFSVSVAFDATGTVIKNVVTSLGAAISAAGSVVTAIVRHAFRFFRVALGPRKGGVDMRVASTTANAGVFDPAVSFSLEDVNANIKVVEGESAIRLEHSE